MGLTIRAMRNRTLEAKNSIEMIMLQILEEYKRDILDLNREDQLFDHGETTEGVVVGYYSEATENEFGGREKGKKAGQHYNFKDTEAMFRGMELEFNDGYLKLFSTDWKGDYWENYLKVKNISGSMFGLNKQNQMILNYEFIKPELIYALKRIING